MGSRRIEMGLMQMSRQETGSEFFFNQAALRLPYCLIDGTIKALQWVVLTGKRGKVRVVLLPVRTESKEN